jgi:replicative DNA helicase
MTEPLHDLELEREVLGAVLLRPELLLSMDVAEPDFYSPAHARIWRELVYLSAEGGATEESVNSLTLRARLLDVHQLAAVGGDEYLLGLTDTIPHGGLPVERLRRLARLRALKAAAARLQAACDTADLEHAVGALTAVHEASLSRTSRNKPVDVLELCEGLPAELDRPVDPLKRFHPGYPIMREVMGLIPERTSVGILANTNVGKSTLCLEILARMAARNQVCGYVSVEDQAPRVRARVAGMLTGVSSRMILQHQLSDHGRAQLYRGMGEIDRLKRHLHFSILPGGTETDVCAAMSELANRGVRVFAVDYLQKVRTSRRGRDNKAHEVADIATAITSHAQKLNGVLFLVSQCSRNKERMNECPSKHDAKESGDLENMLDALIGLWREYEDDYAPMWARMIKTKDGGLGGSWCLQRSETGRLEEVEGSHSMVPPDQRGDWGHREASGTRRARR